MGRKGHSHKTLKAITITTGALGLLLIHTANRRLAKVSHPITFTPWQRLEYYGLIFRNIFDLRMKPKDAVARAASHTYNKAFMEEQMEYDKMWDERMDRRGR